MEPLVYHDRLGYRILRKHQDKPFYQRIKKVLTVSSVDYITQKIIDDKYYYESDKALLLPRLFPIQDYVDPECIGEKEQFDISKIAIESKVTPRNKIQKDSIKHLIYHKNCLLQLDPGSGKTVIAIHVLCQLKMKTIIFVHRDSLLSQWRDRLLQFSNISEDKIGVLSTNTYEDVLKNKDVIIATTQAFNSILRNDIHRKKFLILLYHSGIGLMIGDEVHTTVGAPKFSMASLFVPCDSTIGLSATPDRLDGTFPIMKYHLGEVYESKFSSGTMDAEVDVILFDFRLSYGREHWLNWDGKFQYSRYYQILKNSNIFRKVLNHVVSSLMDQNRHLVVMAERLKFIDELLLEFNGYDTVKFTSGVKNDCLSHKLVLTTPGKMRDGVDAPWKDTIIFTSPVSNINQATGRIVRTYDNKQTPNVIDFVDTGIPSIKNSLIRKRLPFYNKKDWTINYYALTDKGQLEKMDKDEAFRISGMRKF